MNDLGQRTMHKVIWRLVPYLALLYTFNIIDRANVGFARLGMVDSLGFSDAVIDWGYGIFYVGYLLFEVPSNMLLRRFGARSKRGHQKIAVADFFAVILEPLTYGFTCLFQSLKITKKHNGVSVRHGEFEMPEVVFNGTAGDLCRLLLIGGKEKGLSEPINCFRPVFLAGCQISLGQGITHFTAGVFFSVSPSG